MQDLISTGKSMMMRRIDIFIHPLSCKLDRKVEQCAEKCSILQLTTKSLDKWKSQEAFLLTDVGVGLFRCKIIERSGHWILVQAKGQCGRVRLWCIRPLVTMSVRSELFGVLRTLRCRQVFDNIRGVGRYDMTMDVFQFDFAGL